MIQKLSIGITHKILNDIENLAEENEVWQSKNELRQFLSQNSNYLVNFSQILNFSIIKFKKIQENFLSDVLSAPSPNSWFMDKKIDVYEVLDLINPQIRNIPNFKKTFESIVVSNINHLQNYVNLEKDQFQKAKVQVLLRNFMVLINLQYVFGEMSDDGINSFSHEKLKIIDSYYNLNIKK